MANNKLTAFNATTTAATIVPANPFRRILRIQVYGPPDVSPGNTVWVDESGNAAVVQACYQIIPGATLEWTAGERPQEYGPTGAISVITNAGTNKGIIEEIV